MVAHLLGRKGAIKISLIPPEVLQALNEGLIPTVNLNEYLAIDLPHLARVVAMHMGLNPQAQVLTNALNMLSALKPMQRHLHVARALYELTAVRSDRDAMATRLATHPSDVARCWAAHWVMFSAQPLADKLASVHRFAADPHFGVREIAWMSVRDEVVAAPDSALTLLAPWVRDADENIRRFASELTRPRGVWCAQIEILKTQPWRGLPLLEPLRDDPSRYVQNSVANWLNDASKTQPQWVHDVCERWLKEFPTPPTTYIVKRARRSL
jgi:3-methyladenine DNA glycosylase AlkC